MADACVFLMAQDLRGGIFNIGTGEDITIADLASIVTEVVGYTGNLVFDADKPDGTPRKLLDVSRMAALGWKARIGLREGVAAAYRSFLQECAHGLRNAA